ncbi:hypothetical protein [uncultured Mediterranean phage uvMED]|jgi:hypothetical protein|nr:hypothetical protein [uncultured Mediterranean phage uvMED]BAQ90423.1 hypothetical protein [uncultured Mediterranean phage uvMED]
METTNQSDKIYDLEFLDGDFIYVGSDIKAKNLEEAKRVAMVFLQIPPDSELISCKETLIH